MALRLILLALVLSLGLVVQCVPDEVYQSEFTAWMAKHRKSYTATEFITRFATFKSNYDFIQAHNAGGHSFQVGLNELSDLTNEEFKAQYLTLKTPEFTHQYVESIPEPPSSRTSKRQAEAPVEVEEPQQRTTRAVATSIDWLASGAVTAVKDQSTCGCCWAFSTTAAMESINKIKGANGGVLTNFSNQNVLDCTTGPSGTSSCSGGYMADAITSVISAGGIASMTAYPGYTQPPAQASCRYTASMKAGSVSGVSFPLANSDAGLAAVLQVQPLVISFNASDLAFRNYKSGIYTSTTCPTSTNHAMLLYGYGTSNNVQYWKIKNQWGASWGQGGYLQLARGSNMCGVLSYSVYPTIGTPPATFYVFDDAFENGWTLTSSGTVSSLTTTSPTAYKGSYSFSANLAPNAALIITLPQGTLSYRYFHWTVRTSVASSQIGVQLVYNVRGSWGSGLTFGGANSWSSNTLDMQTVSSVAQITFTNPGTSSATYNIDELYFS